jgi:hypothetical protein
MVRFVGFDSGIGRAFSRNELKPVIVVPPDAATGWMDADEERAAIVENDGRAPRAWAEGFARLDRARPPDDVPQRRWLQFIDDCGTFLDSGWPAKAAALGWGPLDLFGCNRYRPFSRIDHMGLLWLLNGRKLVALTAYSATIRTPSGSTLTFHRKLAERAVVVAWEAAT